MAKKKELGIVDATDILLDVIQRAALTDYRYVNNTIIATNPKENTVLIVLEQLLWNSIIDGELKDQLTEADVVKNPNDVLLATYSDNLTDGWFDLNHDDLFAGKLVKVILDEFEYDININKSLIPLKLKKSEFNRLQYRIFPDMTLAIKKQFKYPMDDMSFSIIRLFKIV